MGKRNRKSSINMMFTIALLAVFAMSALFVATIGTQVFQVTQENMEDNYETRTSLVYISEKVKQHIGHEVSLEKFEGSDVIKLTTTYDDQSYDTCIYEYKGQLMEATVKTGDPIDPKFGVAIMPVDDLTMKNDGNLYTFAIKTPNGTENQISVSLKG
ncbi:MAG: DUF4860 domain-containing protein [Clostridiales Family XIII bacterium]|jgi:hypothetical protein|nr:DUF4860 domain-containing protein [Clostridiales Family XIII bacterium]